MSCSIGLDPPAPVVANQKLFFDRFGNDPVAQEMIGKCFSTYRDDVVQVDHHVLNDIDRVVERKKIGTSIAREWQRVILGNTPLNATHRMIPNPELLATAMVAQAAFDKELLILTKLDAYLRLYFGKVQPEIRLLRRANAPNEDECFWGAPEKFNEEDRQFLEGLKEKSAYFGRSFTEQVGQSIRMRKEMLSELKDKILGIYQLSNQEKEWVDPKSARVQELLEATKRLNESSLLESEEFHPSINDHYVFCYRHPILAQSKAKFFILKKSGKLSEDEWQKRIADVWQNLDKELFIRDFKQNQCITSNDPDSSVQICYEDVQNALDSHIDRDLEMKTRRKQLGRGGYERVPVDEGGFVKKVKKMWRGNDWTPNLESTVGADCHEAIALNRHMMLLMLQGEIDRLPQRICQNLGEYFDALISSDAANLKGGYMAYPPFLEALKWQKMMHESQRKYYEAGAITPYLRKGAASNYVWKEERGDGGQSWRDIARVPILIQDIFVNYMKWSQNLSDFLTEIEKHSKVKEEFGEDLLDQLGSFKQSLDEFIQKAPGKEIAEVIGKPVDWTEWRKSKTPEEIDQILQETLVGIQKGLKSFTPSLSQISVPFSSKKTQDAMEKSMEKNINLLNLYRKAIPPIWQNKAKFQALIQGELMKGTEMSPLWLEMAKTMEIADQELIRNEFIRSSLVKQYLLK